MLMINEATSMLEELERLMNLTGIPFEKELCNPTEEELQEFNSDYVLPPELWSHVTWSPRNDEEWKKLFDFERILPFYFDSGVGFGQRDWELDWSFMLTKTKWNYHKMWCKLQRIIHPIDREEFIDVLENKDTIGDLLNVIHPGIYGYPEFTFRHNRTTVYSPDLKVSNEAKVVAKLIKEFISKFKFGEMSASCDFYYHKNKLHILLHTGSNGLEASVLSTLDCWKEILEYCKSTGLVKSACIVDAYFDNCDDVYTAYLVLHV